MIRDCLEAALTLFIFLFIIWIMTWFAMSLKFSDTVDGIEQATAHLSELAMESKKQATYLKEWFDYYRNSQQEEEARDTEIRKVLAGIRGYLNSMETQ